MRPHRNGQQNKRKKAQLTAESLILLLALGWRDGAHGARAQTSDATPPAAAATAPAEATTPAATTTPAAGSLAGSFKSEQNLFDLGVTGPINLRGTDAYDTIYFAIPQNEVVKQASMHLYYHFSPSLIPSQSHLKVMLNGTVFATLPVPQTASNGAVIESDVVIPPDLLVRNNHLTFEFIGHYAQTCEDPTNSALWAHVDLNTRIAIAGDLLPLADDLKLLPLPFFDAQLAQAAGGPHCVWSDAVADAGWKRREC